MSARHRYMLGPGMVCATCKLPVQDSIHLELHEDPPRPAGPPPGTETATIIPGYRLAEVKVTSALHQLGQIAHFVARERDTAVREREEALQEAGRLRARVEELEAVVREILRAPDVVGCIAPADSPLYRARVALDLEGSTGARQIREEAEDRG